MGDHGPRPRPLEGGGVPLSSGGWPTSWSLWRTTSGAPRAAFLADPAPQANRDAIRARFEEWRGLDARLRPLLERSEILREAVPLAAEASALAAAGLEALGFLDQGRPAPASWWAARAALLEREEHPPTGLEVAYRPSVGALDGGGRRRR